MTTRLLATAMLAIGLALAAAAPRPAQAQDDKGTDRPAERAAITKQSAAFLDAVAAGDAKKAAGCWTPSGEYLRGNDLTIRGRDNIEKAYAEYLKKKTPGTIVVEASTLRFLSDAAAIQEGTFRVKKANPADDTRSQFSILYVKDKDTWQFGLVREWSADPSLQELAWLVGTWGYKTETGEATMSFAWSQNRTYLTSQFSMKQADDTITGLQILAVDPETKGIKSWSFDGNGSIGTALWVRTDKEWVSNSTAVNADGDEVTATVVLTPIDANSFQWKMTGRTLDDEKLPDIGPIKVTRKP